MYDHNLRTQAEALVKEGFIQETQVDDVVDALRKNVWMDRIAHVWCIEDVRDVAEVLGVELSEAGQREILHRLHTNFDAMVGINQYVIETNIRLFVLEGDDE